MPSNIAKPVATEVIWGAEEIGRVINRTPRQTFWLLEQGLVPGARKWGRQRALSIPAFRRATHHEEKGNRRIGA
jgi:hypothetical protein